MRIKLDMDLYFHSGILGLKVKDHQYEITPLTWPS